MNEVIPGKIFGDIAVIGLSAEVTGAGQPMYRVRCSIFQEHIYELAQVTLERRKSIRCRFCEFNETRSGQKVVELILSKRLTWDEYFIAVKLFRNANVSDDDSGSITANERCPTANS